MKKIEAVVRTIKIHDI